MRSRSGCFAASLLAQAVPGLSRSASCTQLIALRKHELDNGPLAMLLWQYGLVDIEQLERIFDWLETNQ
ncbi:DUF2949 domain-containing protein [Scytonema hofmannii]|uniref:DUF2949 domain-containing protein n=1 Tax=Scytonema hofmannii TaxID=34078 RepID=UPI0009D70447|nr:DUF2949 domain-containing protein [Scytonema hofmannii]